MGSRRLPSWTLPGRLANVPRSEAPVGDPAQIQVRAIPLSRTAIRDVLQLEVAARSKLDSLDAARGAELEVSRRGCRSARYTDLLLILNAAEAFVERGADLQQI